jgi:hypothetical protein
MRNDDVLARLGAALAAIDGELPKLRAIATPVVAEELDEPRRMGRRREAERRLPSGGRLNRMHASHTGAGSPSVGGRDGRPRPMSSLRGVSCIGILGGLCWLAGLPGEVVGRLVAFGFVGLGVALLAFALGKLRP